MRSRLEEEVKSYEAKIAAMRDDMAALVRTLSLRFTLYPLLTGYLHKSTKEGNLQIAKRKAEREAAEYKQRVLR